MMDAEKGIVMRWIDTRKELPDESERVLLYTPYPVFGDDHACVGNRESITTCTAKIDRKLVPVFTHWMPLPPTPEQHS
jgi:hypothetical protein